MSILLVRHGETALNAARTLQPAATALSPRGRAQASAVARRLGAMRVAGIVSSDLPRAAETAAAIGSACNMPVQWEPLLQERNFGELRGRPYDTLGFDPLTLVEAPAGGESAATFRARVAHAFARLVALRAATAGDLVVVTHGLVIGTLIQMHARLPPGTVAPTRIGNASLTALAAEPPHRIELLDCMRHLDPATRDDPDSLSGG